ncbi:hypothetical protein F2P45_29700 [Massilia sp. CCM 8733]|uniref:Uncharacterized protein n=1 Tax=Massilia mucilaginosa TaxID=2609282 RepID=A0ABX0P2G9_9BURK|nr:hypothetical protein [Massilia mucilaginosa]NHZ93154.1 hypothetical protein [Massilia mucilaginosa]
MNQLPQGFYVDALYCFPVGPDGGTFAVLPAPPTIDTTEGSPGPALLASAAGAALSLQSVWRAEASDLDAVLASIAQRYPQLGAVTLTSAELSDVTATLTLHADAQAAHVIGPQPASATAANRAVFSDTLTTREKEAALRAFRGEAGLLTLTYAGTLTLDEVAGVEITGDLAAALHSLAPKAAPQSGGWFGKKKDSPPPAPPTMAACGAAVRAAVAAGQLCVASHDTPNVSQQARDDATAALFATLADTLFDRLKQMGADAVYMKTFPVKVGKQGLERATFLVGGSADLGQWFAGHDGARLITDTASSIAEPRR